MENNVILIVSSLLLAFGSGGLLVVRLSSPTLKGLGWLGAAFGAGSVGALLLVLERRFVPVLTIPAADALVLAAFVLLHLAFLELTEHPLELPTPGAILICFQVAIDVSCTNPVAQSIPVRTISMGLIIGALVARTGYLLITSRKLGISRSIHFNIILLVSVSVLNICGSMSLACGVLSTTEIAELTPALFVAYIAVALGIAFGFFWMTTGKLCSELEHMASTDPLTRLYNRRIFLEWCEREKLRSERSGKPFSLLMVDLDHFKRINDLFGHSVGDATLCAVVERMQDAVRGIDVLGRWGGEEFVVLLPGASISSAFVVAQRLRSNVEKVIIADLLDGGESPQDATPMSVSVGLASYRGFGDQIGDILERADIALYRAKAAGRNQVLTLA